MKNKETQRDIADNQTGWRFANSSRAEQSSLEILAASFQPNRTYQWMVYMENRRNASVQATGFVLVQVEETRPVLVVIGFVPFEMILVLHH